MAIRTYNTTSLQRGSFRRSRVTRMASSTRSARTASAVMCGLVSSMGDVFRWGSASSRCWSRSSSASSSVAWPATGGARSLTLLGLTDFALAVPRVVLLLLLAALWQPSTILVIAVLGLTGWMGIARLVHGEVRALAARPFVEGAVAVGAKRLRVLARHILPNALTPVIVAAALGVGNAITLEAGLSYLGLGVQPPTPSWGNMIQSGRDTLVNAPWVATAPGVALVLVVIACTLLGDALRDVLDPSTRNL